MRKEEKYLDPTTEREKAIVIKTESATEEEINALFEQFYDNAYDYLDKWTEGFEIFQQFSWISLVTFPEWKQVRPSFDFLAEKTTFDMDSQSADVFKQFGFIKKYCSEQKIKDWNENKVLAEDRWVEIFKHMESQLVPFTAFSAIIEYVFSFPGTSAPVERLFSEINHIWKR